MTASETKALPDGLTATPDGKITAVIATTGVVDRDGDVIAPGAIPSGISVPVSAYGHTSWSGALPVGRGTIREVGSRVMFEGRLFMDTVAGAETYRVLTHLAELAEWSFGFVPVAWHPERRDDGSLVRVLDRLEVFEVSPVLVGAGIGTGTVALAQRQEQLALAMIDRDNQRALAGVRRRDPRTAATFRAAGAIRTHRRNEAAALAVQGTLEALRAQALGVPIP